MSLFLLNSRGLGKSLMMSYCSPKHLDTVAVFITDDAPTVERSFKDKTSKPTVLSRSVDDFPRTQP